MTSIQTKTVNYEKHDDYMTPKYAWLPLVQFIPKDKIIWEAFYGDGQSGHDLNEILPNKIIHEPIDFYKNNRGTMVLSNPPFSESARVLKRLVELEKPFILIMPSSKINTQYFRKLFSTNKDKIQIIIPKKRIHFKKLVNGVVPAGWKSSCNFDTFYYCWKMNLPNDIIWLKD